MNKKKQMKVFKTVDSKGLINELNEIDAAVPTTFPVIFRPVTEDDNSPVNMAGIGEDNMFVWKDDALGTLLTMHEELWVINRYEKIFLDYIGEGDFEILEGSFTGERMVM